MHKKSHPKPGWLAILEPTMRFELTTSSLPRKRSTPELRRQIKKSRQQREWFLERKTGVEPATFSLEGWRSTNWATSAYNGLVRDAFNSTTKKSGESRIRTYEAEATELQSVPFDRSGISPIFLLMSLQRDSNPRPRDYKSRALANWAMEANISLISNNRLSLFASANIQFILE